MNPYTLILLKLALRCLLAAPFFYLGIGGKALMAGPLAALASPFFVLAGAIIVAAPLARLLAEPLGGLLFPNTRYDRPQPIYGIPLARKKEGRYEEAVAGFRAIAAEYPDEVQAWIEMIDVAVTGLEDGARAQAIFQEGMQALRQPEQRQRLAEMYAAIISRLKTDAAQERQPLRFHT